jgi:predicted deacylase
LETVLIPKAKYLIDVHSGGLSLNYLPTLITYPAATPEEGATLDRLVAAFNPPLWMVMDLLTEDRVIGAAAKRNGTVFISGEFGGGASVTPEGVNIVVRGLKRVLGALGITQNDDPPNTIPIKRLQVKPGEHYVYATRRGVFEPRFVLGDVVKAGQIAGLLYDQDEPWNEPVTLHFKGDGLVVCVRTLALVEPGDCLVHLAHVLDD